jgi:hypothetical protein
MRDSRVKVEEEVDTCTFFQVEVVQLNGLSSFYRDIFRLVLIDVFRLSLSFNLLDNLSNNDISFDFKINWKRILNDHRSLKIDVVSHPML